MPQRVTQTRSRITPYQRKTFVTVWESRWHWGKLYLQETPLCHETANGYCHCCSLAWVCGKLWKKEELDKVCQMPWGWSRVLICRQVIPRVSTVVHLQVPVAGVPHHTLSWATAEELRGICVLARKDQESMQPQVGLDGEERSTADPHHMTEGISYWEELCGLG